MPNRTTTPKRTATKGITATDPSRNLKAVAITPKITNNDQVAMVHTPHSLSLLCTRTNLPLEMTNMNGSDPNRILNECRGVDQAIDEIEADLQRLKGLQSRYLADTNSSAQSPLRLEVDRLGDNIMTKYRGLVSRVKNIKQQPESGNPRNAPQVGKVDRRLKTAINQYQQVEREFRKASQDQMARQYRIVRPDASDAEVREAVEDPNNQQIFSSALIQSDRRGEAQTVARNVSQRHEDIQKIERQMIELAQLFQDLEALVVQQEPAVTQIEQRGEEVTEHVAKANTELTGAVKKARAARRKKWMCLGIVSEYYDMASSAEILLTRIKLLLSSLSLSLWWWLSKLRSRALVTKTTLPRQIRPGGAMALFCGTVLLHLEISHENSKTRHHLLFKFIQNRESGIHRMATQTSAADFLFTLGQGAVVASYEG